MVLIVKAVNYFRESNVAETLKETSEQIVLEVLGQKHVVQSDSKIVDVVQRMAAVIGVGEINKTQSFILYMNVLKTKSPWMKDGS